MVYSALLDPNGNTCQARFQQVTQPQAGPLLHEQSGTVVYAPKYLQASIFKTIMCNVKLSCTPLAAHGMLIAHVVRACPLAKRLRPQQPGPEICMGHFIASTAASKTLDHKSHALKLQCLQGARKRKAFPRPLLTLTLRNCD